MKWTIIALLKSSNRHAFMPSLNHLSLNNLCLNCPTSYRFIFIWFNKFLTNPVVVVVTKRTWPLSTWPTWTVDAIVFDLECTGSHPWASLQPLSLSTDTTNSYRQPLCRAIINKCHSHPISTLNNQYLYSGSLGMNIIHDHYPHSLSTYNIDTHYPWTLSTFIIHIQF